MVLYLIDKDNKALARNLAKDVGITERSTRRIIKNLQDEGYLQIEKDGRTNRYKINPDALLRRQALGNKTVGELMKALS